MHQSRAGQSSSSDERPDTSADAASSALQVIFENPQSPRPPGEPSLELPSCFTSLIKDLSQEEGQLRRRKEHGLDNAGRLRHKLARLRKIDLVRDQYQRLILDHWEKIIIIAATIVDSYLGNEILATSTITNLNGGELAYHTILKDRKVVREMIKLTDHLYVHWKHELAFEVPMLLDTPISTLRLQSTLKFNKLERLLQYCIPSTKIESCFKLYIPFLVLFIRPKYSLTDIETALQTSLLDQSDWDIFWRAVALEYNPIRDNWVPKHSPAATTNNLEMQEYIDYKGNYPIKARIQVSGYKAFETSLDLQQKAALASKSQVGYNRTNSSIFAYNWDENIHSPVMQQVIYDLAKLGYIEAEDVYVDKVSVSLISGSTVVPPGRLQIVVPTAPLQGSLPISLTNKESSTVVEWNMQTGFILDQNTVLSATADIGYISLLAVF
ncbi:hypothetical protein FLAG1_09494 [Fusarium langsethiae]|uniref:Uncharacterized protein n=1 Tax=Fusarium langsethiae TaxID=179993 RepID=A0A0N0DC46_FUSLA|nr:hypothetical protein FLAG1_09494 [Fusarium langsethiae]GKU22983.1 unnamed protein product [Fusarium langsethiae]